MVMKLFTNPRATTVEPSAIFFEQEDGAREGADVCSNCESSDGGFEFGDSEESQEEKQVLAKRESKAVFRVKLIVLLVLAIFAVVVAIVVYFYVTGSETSQFEDQFKDDAHKVLEAIGSNFEETLGSFDNLAVATVSFARAANQEWPFVTLPNFALRAAKLNQVRNYIGINLVPIVTDVQRAEWELFASNDTNLAWVNETLSIQDTWKDYRGPEPVWNWTKNNVIHGDFGDVPYNTSLMLPTWQNFPLGGVCAFSPEKLIRARTTSGFLTLPLDVSLLHRTILRRIGIGTTLSIRRQ